MNKSAIQTPQPAICLTIAGLDPSGGAGIIADIKTFTAFGCFATAAIASLTFQNTVGVFGAVHQTADTVGSQAAPVFEDFNVAAVKTGMLPSREIIEEVAALIKEYKIGNFVVDPVVRSTSGFDLITDDALESLIENLFPLSTIITPNLPEAERIAKISIKNDADIERAAEIMQSRGAKNVLIKGGHQANAECGMRNEHLKMARDFLFVGENLEIFDGEWIETTATHGTGCTLAAGIAANLARGESLSDAVRIAKDFVTNAIRTAPRIGRGHSPINHTRSI